MTHDPLCVCSRKDHAHFFYTIPSDVCMACKCEDIAKVRADEREQAAQRIDGHSQHGYRCECGADLNNYESHLQNVIRGEVS